MTVSRSVRVADSSLASCSLLLQLPLFLLAALLHLEVIVFFVLHASCGRTIVASIKRFNWFTYRFVLWSELARLSYRHLKHPPSSPAPSKTPSHN